MNRSAEYWFNNWLTEDEQIKYLRNMHGYGLSLFEPEISFYKFITGGFVWSNSQEGHDYWSEINQRVSPVKMVHDLVPVKYVKKFVMVQG